MKIVKATYDILELNRNLKRIQIEVETIFMNYMFFVKIRKTCIYVEIIHTMSTDTVTLKVLRQIVNYNTNVSLITSH